MDIALPYRETTVTVHISDSRCAGVLYPNSVETTDEDTVIHAALDNARGDSGFDLFTAGSGEILVIVNDATRPTPTARILSRIKHRLPLSRCRFLVATGSHRVPNEEELHWIFGDLYPVLDRQNRIHCHDARDEDAMVYIGDSAAGHPIHINRHVADAGKILVITTVEPHYFGGYTGGRKSFLPGVTAYETIRLNHRLALQPEAATLALDRNPVHLDMDSCLERLASREIFALQAVLNRHRHIYAAYAGDIRRSFRDAVAAADRVFCVPITHKADVVVSAAPHPMDIDLYQSQKAIENAKPALKSGGIIILLSSCRTGIGPETFYRLMADCKSPSEVMSRIRDEYKLGFHKAAKMVEASLMGEVWGVTDLDPASLEAVFIHPQPDIQTAVDAALQKTGTNSKVLFIPEGSITVPRVSSEN